MRVLDSVPGKKGLVIDARLSGPLSLIAEYSLLKEHGVDKIFHLSKDRPDTLTTDFKHLVYICRPNIANVKHIASHVRQYQSNLNHQISAGNTMHSLFFVPRRTLVCERLLEEEGVYADVVIAEFRMDLVPLEEDLWSLEMPEAFRDLYLDGDTTVVFYVAKALMKIQSMFGIIPRVLGKGKQARTLCDLILRMRRELTLSDNHLSSSSSNNRSRHHQNQPSSSSTSSAAAASELFPARSDIDSIIIIDRTVDLVGPMCSQLTYEGLIDEIFGVKSTFVELEASVFGGPSTTPSSSSITTAPPSAPPAATARLPTRKVPLNSGDRIFKQLRDLNFAVVGAVLNQNARRIQEEIEGRHQAKTVSQIKDFIGKLGGIEVEKASLKLHTTLAEQIAKYTMDQDFNKTLAVQQNLVAGAVLSTYMDLMEELIDRQAPILQVLRLLCLYSLTNGGMKQKNYEFFKREIVQTYGVEHLWTLQNLFTLRLLNPTDLSTGLRSTISSGSSGTASGGSGTGGGGGYNQVRRLLRLIVDDVDEARPTDMSYVYSGFAPITCRLVQAAATKRVLSANTTAVSVGTTAVVGSPPPTTLSSSSSAASIAIMNQHQDGVASMAASPSSTSLIGGLLGAAASTLAGVAAAGTSALSSASGGGGGGGMSGTVAESVVSWKGWEDALKMLPGGVAFEEVQKTPDSALLAKRSLTAPKVTIVLFLGGCTFSEVSSLRFLSKREDGREFITMTTGIINGSSLLTQAMEKVQKRPLHMEPN